MEEENIAKKKTNKKILKPVIVVLILITGAFYAGVRVAPRFEPEINRVTTLSNKEEGRTETVNFAPFWAVWNLLNEKYVPATTTDPVTDQEKVYGAIAGLTASLGDPHTVFFPPVESKQFEEEINGNFEGVGIEIGIQDGILTVIAPLKGTPAYRAGVKAGDKIIRVDEVLTAKLSIEEAIKLIRGERGTPVVFTVAREGVTEPIEITIYRDVIDIPTIETSVTSEGIFVIELYNFSANSPQLFRNALREFVESRSERLLLDLRGNPGGFLEAAIDMASWFLPAGKTVVVEDFGGNEDDVIYRSKGYDVFNDQLKMVILVDGGSASASEILAGALREHGRATLVGAKTFGKGSVQELVDLPGKTSLKVTIAHWLTPNGVSLSDNGLEPDVVVELTAEDVAVGGDPQRVKAIELLLNM